MSEVSFRLQSRDRQILKAVNDCQVLQISHISTMFFGSIKPAYGRVKKLVDAGYLEVHYLSAVTSAPASSERIFTISRQGAMVLADTFGYSREEIHYASRQVKSAEKVKSILDLNRFRAYLYRASHDHPRVELVRWVNEAKFRAQPDQVYIKNANGADSKKPIYPDGFFQMQVAVRDKVLVGDFFVESDSGLEGYAQFQTQMEIYQAYILSGLFEERFQSQSLRILIITNGETRLKKLMEKTAQVGGRDRYWFTTFDRFESRPPEAILSTPIWSKINQGELQTLIPSLEL